VRSLALLFSRPLAVVTPTVDGDVLAVLARADTAFSAGQLQRLIGERSYGGVRKALLRLVRQGIVTTETVGNAHTYRLNREHVAAPAVTELANLRSVLLDRLRGAFEDWAHPPVFAALFGSAARQDMRLGSDIDLFLVLPSVVAPRSDEADGEGLEAWQRDTDRLQRDATAWSGNDVRIFEMGEEEVRAGVAAGDPLLGAAQAEGVILCGSNAFWRQVRRG